MCDILPNLLYSGGYPIPHSIFDKCVPNPRSFNNDILRRIDEQRTITRGLGKYLRDNPMPKMYEGDIRFHGQ